MQGVAVVSAGGRRPDFVPGQQLAARGLWSGACGHEHELEVIDVQLSPCRSVLRLTGAYAWQGLCFVTLLCRMLLPVAIVLTVSLHHLTAANMIHTQRASACGGLLRGRVAAAWRSSFWRAAQSMDIVVCRSAHAFGGEVRLCCCRHHGMMCAWSRPDRPAVPFTLLCRGTLPSFC